MIKIINTVSRYLKDIGIEFDIIELPEDFLGVHYPYRPLHKCKKRYIILAKVGSGRPIIHFNAHYDVVPAQGKLTYSPFRATIVGDRVYGRGTSDDKGSIACLLVTLKSLVECKVEFRGTIEVALVPDEEAGGIGIRYLVESKLVNPDYVIVCEPTNLKVVIGYKGHCKRNLVQNQARTV